MSSFGGRPYLTPLASPPVWGAPMTMSSAKGELPGFASAAAAPVGMCLTSPAAGAAAAAHISAAMCLSPPAAASPSLRLAADAVRWPPAALAQAQAAALACSRPQFSAPCALTPLLARHDGLLIGGLGASDAVAIALCRADGSAPPVARTAPSHLSKAEAPSVSSSDSSLFGRPRS